MGEQEELIYRFERTMQKPALAMMLRGINIDQHVRTSMMARYEDQRDRLERWLNQLAVAIWDKGLNPNSPAQLKELFYEFMSLPREYKYHKGEKKVSTDRDCLERLSNKFDYTRPLISTILAMRDATKKLSVLKTAVDNLGRFRCSYNPAGTNTGRWSSSRSVFGHGSNAQNITEELREAFIPDPGYKICYLDLEQAESRAVAYLSEDLDYIQACESGDLHTSVSKMVWPELPWNGDDGPKDRAVADTPFYRHFTYRAMAKRGGHATNYRITPFSMARALKVQSGIVEAFQERYFDKFKGIPRWHAALQRQLQSTACLVTPMGRKRVFHDRLSDDSTLRKAIAYVPQSTIGDLLNLGLLRVWKYLDTNRGVLEILGQVHDAVVLQVRESHLFMIGEAAKLMVIPVPINGRIMIVPVEGKYGDDWKNLKTYHEEEHRCRATNPIDCGGCPEHYPYPPDAAMGEMEPDPKEQCSICEAELPGPYYPYKLCPICRKDLYDDER
jgi:DNA polymerase-1